MNVLIPHIIRIRITICWVRHTLWSSPPTVGTWNLRNEGFFFWEKTHVMSLLDTQEMNLLLLEIEYHESLEDFIKIKIKLKKKREKKKRPL